MNGDSDMKRNAVAPIDKARLKAADDEYFKADDARTDAFRTLVKAALTADDPDLRAAALAADAADDAAVDKFAVSWKAYLESRVNESDDPEARVALANAQAATRRAAEALTARDAAHEALHAAIDAHCAADDDADRAWDAVHEALSAG